MRTLIVIGIGLALALAFVFGAGFLHKSKSTGAAWFIGAWLIFCVVDYCIGVFQAGYSPWDELWIHLGIFLLPAAVAFYFSR
jgi:hypothetical protein